MNNSTTTEKRIGDPCNAASWRLLERLGFTREAHFRQDVFFRRDAADKPIWKDTYVYGLLNSADRDRAGAQGALPRRR